jgi:hypothetical protein
MATNLELPNVCFWRNADIGRTGVEWRFLDKADVGNGQVKSQPV